MLVTLSWSMTYPDQEVIANNLFRSDRIQRHEDSGCINPLSNHLAVQVTLHDIFPDWAFPGHGKAASAIESGPIIWSNSCPGLNGSEKAPSALLPPALSGL